MNGKICVVTGGAQGLGKEFALKLLNNGGRVCITDINETQGLETVQDLTDNLGHSPKNVTFCRQDVRQKDDWEAVFGHCQEFFQGEPVEVLVNNAGVTAAGDYEQVVDINLMGVMHGTAAFMEKYGISKGGRGGRVVQLASMAGLFGGLPFQHFGYSVSKWGVVSLTRSFSDSTKKKILSVKDQPYGPDDGVKSYCLCPFFVRTAMTAELHDKSLAKRGTRKLTVDEVSKVMLDALRDDINGAVIMVFPDLPAVRIYNFNNLMFLLFPVFKLYRALFPHTTAVDSMKILILVLLLILFVTFILGMGAHALIMT